MSRPTDKQREAIARQQQEEDFRWLMGTAQGRRVMYRLLYGLCGLEDVSASATDASTYMREGRRAVGIELKRTLHRLCPADVVHMVAEAVSALQQEALSSRGAKAETDDGDGEPGSR